MAANYIDSFLFSFHKERYSEFKKHAALLDYHTKVKILRQFSPAVEAILDDTLPAKKFREGLTHVFSYLNQHGILKAAEDLGLASPTVVSRSNISSPSKIVSGFYMCFDRSYEHSP